MKLSDLWWRKPFHSGTQYADIKTTFVGGAAWPTEKVGTIYSWADGTYSCINGKPEFTLERVSALAAQCWLMEHFNETE